MIQPNTTSASPRLQRCTVPCELRDLEAPISTHFPFSRNHSNQRRLNNEHRNRPKSP
ncbi:hypothetical protein NA56DRAFT_643310 [Hyaloscypha hepaticicola]|uniref:Uncharacterized protein n=1 Tax=Hyaloscypha hepaticicola TaxID=2082293 RepID=A0A2J6QCL7_9HELO|nr:hypothetical protein NA56DRAFT_643310 [Hyaloscypha hepaticicola]